MASFASVTELHKMALPELTRECADLKGQAAKMRLSIGMQTEKNHALYRRTRRQIARIETVIGAMFASGLKKQAPAATVGAPKTPGKKSAGKKKKAKIIPANTPRS